MIGLRQMAGLRWSSASWVFAGSLVLVAAVYITLALDLAQFRAFWSPDSGVRFWMIRNWVERGDLIYLPYEAAAVDPTGRLHPLSAGYPGYIAQLKQALCTIYPPLFPFLCGVFYRVLGFPGLTVIPVCSGLGTVVLVTASARRLRLRLWSAIPVAIGLATPLVLYSAVFWDHATYMLVSAAALYLLIDALDQGRDRSALLAGATLGLGVWLHEFFFVLLAAVVFGALIGPRDSRPRQLVRPVLCGFAALVLGWALCNLWLYGMPAGAHVLGANDPRQPKMMRRLMAVEWMIQQSLEQLIGASPWSIAILYLMAAYVAAHSLRGRAGYLSPLILLVHIGVALFVTREKWVNGFFAATPVLVLALPGRWYGAFPRVADSSAAPRASAEISEIWLSRLVFLFAGLVLLIPLGGGTAWGNRAMLTALPGFALVAAMVTQRSLDGSHGLRSRFWVVSLAVLIAGSAASQVRGWRAIRLSHQERRQELAPVEALSTALVATDDWVLWPHSSVLNRLPRQRFVIRNRPQDRWVFAQVLDRLRPDQFTYLASGEAAANLQSYLLENGLPTERSVAADGRTWVFTCRQKPARGASPSGSAGMAP